MAEFCKQCAEELDFEPDFTGLFTEHNATADGEIGFNMLCESCSPAFIVDDAGTCGSHYCDRKHGGDGGRADTE